MKNSPNLLIGMRVEDADIRLENAKDVVNNLRNAQAECARFLKDALGEFNLPKSCDLSEIRCDFDIKNLQYLFAVYSPEYPDHVPLEPLHYLSVKPLGRYS